MPRCRLSIPKPARHWRATVCRPANPWGQTLHRVWGGIRTACAPHRVLETRANGLSSEPLETPSLGGASSALLPYKKILHCAVHCDFPAGRWHAFFAGGVCLHHHYLVRTEAASCDRWTWPMPFVSSLVLTTSPFMRPSPWPLPASCRAAALAQPHRICLPCLAPSALPSIPVLTVRTMTPPPPFYVSHWGGGGGAITAETQRTTETRGRCAWTKPRLRMDVKGRVLDAATLAMPPNHRKMNQIACTPKRSALMGRDQCPAQAPAPRSSSSHTQWAHHILMILCTTIMHVKEHRP